VGPVVPINGINLAPQPVVMSVFPNPCREQLTIRYRLDVPGTVKMELYDMNGKPVIVMEEGYKHSGDYNHPINTAAIPTGNYVAVLSVNNVKVQSIKVLKLQ
jgi:hypothetical protein